MQPKAVPKPIRQLPCVRYSWCQPCRVAHRNSCLDYPTVTGDVDTDGDGQGSAPVDHYPEIGHLIPDDLVLDSLVVVEDAISQQEELELVHQMDQSPWKVSQSGRRKQDFGPAVNFKKKKMNLKKYTGLPAYIRDLTSRLAGIPELADFVAVEQGNLEYTSTRGSANDAHVDDEWAWGERLCTLTLLQDCCMTFEKRFTAKGLSALVPTCGNKANKACAVVSPALLGNTQHSRGGSLADSDSDGSVEPRERMTDRPVPGRQESDAEVVHFIVNVRLPRCSLIVSQGDMRHGWTHAILRENIIDRRISLTLRELGPDFREGEVHAETGQRMLELATQFEGVCV